MDNILRGFADELLKSAASPTGTLLRRVAKTGLRKQITEEPEAPEHTKKKRRRRKKRRRKKEPPLP